MYLADFKESIWKISLWGEIEVITNAMHDTSGNALDRKENLYQSNYFGNTINKISRNGDAKEIAGTGLNGPFGIALKN